MNLKADNMKCSDNKKKNKQYICLSEYVIKIHNIPYKSQ